METFYFCINLTSGEHEIVEHDIEKFIATCDNGKLVYYRQLKDGHIPMFREAKIEATQSVIDHFKRWCFADKFSIGHNFVQNPHKKDSDA